MDNEQLNTEERTIREVSHPLYSSKGWIKLVGILLGVENRVDVLTGEQAVGARQHAKRHPQTVNVLQEISVRVT